jgi:hypothetical protein
MEFMPTIVRKFSDLDLNKTYTYSDYLLWQLSERVELIKCCILKMTLAPAVKEYWLVDPNHRMILIYTLKKRRVYRV